MTKWEIYDYENPKISWIINVAWLFSCSWLRCRSAVMTSKSMAPLVAYPGALVPRSLGTMRTSPSRHRPMRQLELPRSIPTADVFGSGIAAARSTKGPGGRRQARAAHGRGRSETENLEISCWAMTFFKNGPNLLVWLGAPAKLRNESESSEASKVKLEPERNHSKCSQVGAAFEQLLGSKNWIKQEQRGGRLNMFYILWKFWTRPFFWTKSVPVIPSWYIWGTACKPGFRSKMGILPRIVI